MPDFAEKGSDFVFEISYKRILRKSVVEVQWLIAFDNGTELSGKGLIGWNADQNEIVQGAMSSIGGMQMGTISHDKDASSITLKAKGIDGDGEKTSITISIAKTEKDSLTWKALERTGGIVEGPSPLYTFKRVKRAKQQGK